MAYELLEESEPAQAGWAAFRSYLIPGAIALLSAGLLVAAHLQGGVHTTFLGSRLSPPPPPCLSGWMQSQWVKCTSVAQPCPMRPLDFPHSGCTSQVPSSRLLLTADGLSSPHARSKFHDNLNEVVKTAAPIHSVEKRVLLVLDAAYDAFRKGTQFTDADVYCTMRQAELKSLGASAVTCVLLDPEMRLNAWKEGQTRGGAARSFGDLVYKLDDDKIFQELSSANAIFVECGSPVPLAKNFRRTLNLSEKIVSAVNPDTARNLKDLVRARVQDPSGGLLYIGVSSGTSLAGEIMIDMSSNDRELLAGDNSGLGLVPTCSFYPHIDTISDGGFLHNLSRAYDTSVMAVPDCEPVADDDSKIGRLDHICP